MERTVDARGLACPLPALKARLAVRELRPGEAVVVLATDREAPIDVGAVAQDAGCTFTAEREGDGWRMRILRP